MPTKIEQVFDQPKVFELIKAIGNAAVKNQLEFELVKVASLMSVGGNLNKAQVKFIAEQLIELYPNESIADFRICFQRGCIGTYGDIQRMDGITIRGWFDLYLEEKYQLLEDKLMKEKDTPYKVPVKDVGMSEEAYQMLEQFKNNLKSSAKAVRPMTEKEIKEEGQVIPKKNRYIQNDNAVYMSNKRIEYGRIWADPNSFTGLLKKGAPDFEQWLQDNP